MSHFKTIYEFMQNVPQALRHEEIYRSVVERSSSNENRGDVDMSAWEMTTVGLGEMNLLRDLDIPDKFRLPGMDVEFDLNSSSLAKAQGKTGGKGSLTGKRIRKEGFGMEESLAIRPTKTTVLSSQRKGVQIPRNEALYTEISAALSGMSARALSSPSIGALGEMVIIRQDLRHLFLKGYLMLMSYNLAVASDVKDVQYNDLRADIQCEVSGEKKLVILLSYPIVVDVEHLTREELWLLIEMSEPYPSSRYGEANIYNNIALAGDTMCLITRRGECELGVNPGHGSPERMWDDMVSLAIKMDAIEDLREVVRDFRGMPGILRSVSELTGKRSFTCHYPLSYSVNMAIESINVRNPFITRHSGYYATTKCLIADLMLSQMLDMSAFNIIEELGGLGVIGCPGGNAVTNSLLNSNLRGKGLRHGGEEMNELLQEWRGARGSSVPVNFDGKLKDYVLQLAQEIKNGDVHRLRPQLLYALPYSRCNHTTWATIRGWKFQDFKISTEGEARVRANQMLKAFTWVMGVSDDLPSVCFNGFGEKFVRQLSDKEMELMDLAEGEYKISLVRHTSVKMVEPRMDEFELGMTAFYNTSFPGIRCTIVYDNAGNQSIISEDKVEYSYQKASVGRIDEEENGGYYTPGGSYVKINKSMSESGPGVPEGRPVGSGKGVSSEESLWKEQTERMRTRGLLKPASEEAAGKERVNGVAGKEGTEEEREKELRRREGRSGREEKDIRSKDKDDVDLNKERRKESEGDVSRKERDRQKEVGQERAEKDNSVYALEKGILQVRKTPTLVRDGNGLKPQEVITHDGKSVKIQVWPRSEPLNQNAEIRGYRLKTTGDGKCGIHAFVQDLALKGYIGNSDKDAAFRRFSEAVPSDTFHDLSEIAAVGNSLGMGVTLIDKNYKRVCEYGVKDALENCIIVRDGAHFETFIEDPAGPDIFQNYKFIDRRITPAEMLANIKRVYKWFAGSSILDDQAAKLLTSEEIQEEELSGMEGARTLLKSMQRKVGGEGIRREDGEDKKSERGKEKDSGKGREKEGYVSRQSGKGSSTPRSRERSITPIRGSPTLRGRVDVGTPLGGTHGRGGPGYGRGAPGSAMTGMPWGSRGGRSNRWY